MSGTGALLVALSGELLRRYLDAQAVAEQIRLAAFSKAQEAGGLAAALSHCLEVVRTCGQ